MTIKTQTTIRRNQRSLLPPGIKHMNEFMLFTIDYENNSSFWDYWHQNKNNPETPEEIRCLDESFIVDSVRGKTIEKWLKKAPGWWEKESPEYALHPIIIDTLTKDEAIEDWPEEWEDYINRKGCNP